MRVALVHDFLNQRGGAERVAAALCRIFPDAPLFTSFYDPDETFDDFRGVDIRTSYLQHVPHGPKAFRALLPLYPAAFRSFDLSGYDLVISSSTHWAHHVRARGAFHAVYCHNPPRWLYQTGEYLTEGGPVPSWARRIIGPMLSWLRNRDLRAASRPDLYIANSKVVAGRIKQLYGRDAPVVNPPIDVERFFGISKWEGGDGKKHYLVVGRLLPYKRIDLAIEVCNSRSAPLVVVGDGPARADLESKAGPTVRFAGKVSDEELLTLFAGAKALLQCGTEDFGMAPLEANAAGIPVVAFRNGGALEVVIPDETGILFPEQQGGTLSKALDRLESGTWNPDALRAHASRFDEDSFEKGLLSVLEERLGRAAK